MAALTPPFDIVPKLPGKAVNLVVQQINKRTDRIVDNVNEFTKKTTKLPLNASCDDPQVKQMKQDLQQIQQQITQLRNIVPQIQTIVNSVQQVVNTAVGVKTAITVAQLSNPVTAPLFIAQQLMAIQDSTIANAISSLDQFKSIPGTLSSKIASIVPSLTSAVNRLSATCNGDLNGLEQLELPTSIMNEVSGIDNAADNGDIPDSEFYTELNVSDEDIEFRTDTIEQLVQQQRDLLTSLLEAPSQVYKQAGSPAPDLGKPGDYYIDTETNTIYGPKLNATTWTAP